MDLSGELDEFGKKLGLRNEDAEKENTRDWSVPEGFDQNYLKVTLEGMIGLIGGTMGLLTGFSILSGVEIIYFVLRFSKCL